ncbi:hypothetical protein EC973_000115 [Apophysomyces ossiformis]|uniref:RlpA-like protein double-psi beta-barrel domain-containing protein n=1 Tax=Apophysomyces ossiformis TaxID=679940 RepID=A0A8H7BZM6_9FUNG|nr:hypothetical protein EC973_000115 [Apophysomyces ossiformis]
MRSVLLLISLVLCLFALAEAARTNDAGRQVSRAERVVLEKRKKKHHSNGNSSNSAGQGGFSGTFSGRGTFFTPSSEGGSTGACGPHEADDAPIVAINREQYGDTSRKSEWCGKKLRISYNGKSVTATVNDACPGCGYGGLDLTKPLFRALAPLTKGIIQVTWEVI